jgi:hypothetical protein
MNRMAKVAAIALIVGIAGMFAAPALATDAPAQATDTAPAQADGAQALAFFGSNGNVALLPESAMGEAFEKYLMPELQSELQSEGLPLPQLLQEPQPQLGGPPMKKAAENKVVLVEENDNESEAESKAKNDNDIDNEAEAKCNQDDKGHKKPCGTWTDTATVDEEAEFVRNGVPVTAAASVPAAGALAPRAEY